VPQAIGLRHGFLEKKNMSYAATAASFNEARAEKFAEQMLGIINNAALALMASIGHRTGLFDVMSKLPASTSAGIAEAANLNERYVREWLGAMTTGRVVEYDETSKTYWLPGEHAAFLTRAASPNNLAVTTQFIPVLASVEDRIIESFRKGGGVPYSAYPRFHEVMAEESGQTVVAGLFDHILPLAPGLIEKLRHGIEVLDVGCGRGRALIQMAAKFPNSGFTGYDFSEEAVGAANREAAERGLKNIGFEVKDVAIINGRLRFNLITAFDAIHDQAQPARVLAAIAGALEDDGLFLMQDIAGSSHVHKNLEHPLGPLTYTVSCLHCMTVSLAQGGAGLGAAWGEEKALQMHSEAGFANVEVKRLPHDIMNNYYLGRLQ
jgi:2-polyprenyl-3-methyl-5-hydroxy-6-metoxy-1,4-benzoquinol methylase